MLVRSGDRTEIRDADVAAGGHAEFMVLHEGRIQFRGSAAELLASEDAYLKTFLSGWIPPLVA